MLIVQKVVKLATLMDTAMVGEDTDLLSLLCYHASLDSHNIFFQPEPKKNTKKPQVWNIKAVKEQLGPEKCTIILSPSLPVSVCMSLSVSISLPLFLFLCFL